MDAAELTAWLVDREERYGGRITGVPRDVVSPHDPRTPAQLAKGGMQGGDRMGHHGYAAHYAEHLLPFLGRPVVLVEVGVLTGIGLAIWWDLFPAGAVIGLDIDPGIFDRNERRLRDLGAFAGGRPTVRAFDQLDPADLTPLLEGRKIDIYIDDGLHTDDAVMTSLNAVRPHLAAGAVGFIEDNAGVHGKVREVCPDVASHGRLTVCRF